MPQKILIIDDSEQIHVLLKVRLRDEAVEIHSALDGESGLAAAQTLCPDLILLDVEMPGTDGFAVCRSLKHNPGTVGIPVIFLTGVSTPEEKIRGLNLGAVDYVTKPFDPAELRARVRASLRTKYLLDLLARKAMIDGLTGLWNRVYLDQRLASELSLAARGGGAVSCLMADIDHFKAVNDDYGHPFGDLVLRGIAQIFLAECRSEDVVCRYGGEEFAILMPTISLAGATTLAERLRQCVAANPFVCAGRSIHVTASFGVSGIETGGPIPLIEAADQALYAAKKRGRNCCVTAEDIAESMHPVAG